MKNNDGKLTSEQIANWRRTVLPSMFGSFALIMTDEEIQNVRDAIQRRVEDERKDNHERTQP